MYLTPPATSQESGLKIDWWWSESRKEPYLQGSAGQLSSRALWKYYPAKHLFSRPPAPSQFRVNGNSLLSLAFRARFRLCRSRDERSLYSCWNSLCAHQLRWEYGFLWRLWRNGNWKHRAVYALPQNVVIERSNSNVWPLLKPLNSRRMRSLLARSRIIQISSISG